MKQSSESVSLYLDNKFCHANAGRANAVFKIDFPAILGDMYYKYSKLKIVINSYHSLIGATARTPYYEGNMYLKMKGLNFVNSSGGGSLNEGTGQSATTFVPYATGVTTGTQSQEATLQIVNTGSGGMWTTSQNYFHNGRDSIIFVNPGTKPVDVSFVLRDLRQNATPPSFLSDTYHFTISLTIYGLYDDAQA